MRPPDQSDSDVGFLSLSFAAAAAAAAETSVCTREQSRHCLYVQVLSGVEKGSRVEGRRERGMRAPAATQQQ